jgi:hypothetical protein
MCQKQGPSRGRVPSLREIEKIIAAPFHFSPFGADLEEIMAHERSLNPSAQVPRIVEFLCDSVMRLNGCNIEGLFRIPGDSEGIYTSKADIECGNFDISNFRVCAPPLRHSRAHTPHARRELRGDGTCLRGCWWIAGRQRAGGAAQAVAA